MFRMSRAGVTFFLRLGWNHRSNNALIDIHNIKAERRAH